VPTVDSGSQPPKAFIYQPLDPDLDVDSVRLVLIEPSISHDDPLSCILINVKFAEKLRFKAFHICGEMRLSGGWFSSLGPSFI
jgi:hypothetical protein